ncbi:MAG TPA: phage holin family protein [Steroidobacteraceae bacterium]|nr:phage holin family protein [Steroidobacteraceae bacterium]
MTPEEHAYEPGVGVGHEPHPEETHDARERARQQRTIIELLQRLTRDASTLVRDEVELVRAETRESIDRTRHSITQFVSAAIFFMIGGLALTAALIMGLAEFMDEWIAALAVGIVALIIGWALRSRASSNLSPSAMKPRRTAHSLRRDREMLKEKLS